MKHKKNKSVGGADSAPQSATTKRHSANQGTSSNRTSPTPLRMEALEPRILLSATWVGTDANDVHDAGQGHDVLYGMGGDDELTGGKQQDQLYGGDGNDILHGGMQQDLLDGGAGDDQLFGGDQSDVLISGGGNDFLDGGMHDDTFRFDGAQDGDVVTVVGGHGNDTIDLSGYHNDQISDDGSSLNVGLAGGGSFTVHYTDVETIVTSEGEYAPGSIPAGGDGGEVVEGGDADDDGGVSVDDELPEVVANTAPVATGGNMTLAEGGSGVVRLSGSDPDAGDGVESYRIDTLPEHGTLSLDGQAVAAGDSITQDQIDSGALSFTPDAEYHGATSFDYSAYDGDDFSDTPATFTITVTPVDDEPLAPPVDVGESVDEVAPEDSEPTEVPEPKDVLEPDDSGPVLESGSESTDSPAVSGNPPVSSGAASNEEIKSDVVEPVVGSGSDQPHTEQLADGDRIDSVHNVEIGNPASGDYSSNTAQDVDVSDSGADTAGGALPDGDGPVVWDDTEELSVLDPTGELGDAIALEREFSDDASVSSDVTEPAAAFDGVPAAQGLDEAFAHAGLDFVTDRVIEMDSGDAQLEGLTDVVPEDSMTDGGAAESFEPVQGGEWVGPGDNTVADPELLYQSLRDWAAGAPHHAGHDPSDGPRSSTDRNDTSKSADPFARNDVAIDADDEHVGASKGSPLTAFAGGGFFARLWAIVRGIGPIKQRSDDPLAGSGRAHERR